MGAVEEGEGGGERTPREPEDRAAANASYPKLATPKNSVGLRLENVGERRRVQPISNAIGGTHGG
jgi:hypothetical protein